MVPRLARVCFTCLKAGRYPDHWKEGRYQKYEGRFAEVIGKRDRGMGVSLTEEEVYTLYSGALAVQDLDGAIAECGVFRGGSARIICEVKGDKPLYLFDTCEGMPDKRISGQDTWEKGTHKETSLTAVQEYLKDYGNVHFVPGLFPDSIAAYTRESIANLKFSFVHLDLDLYECTLDALKFFYPRLVPGGRIVSHNYNESRVPGGATPGVRAAFMEYVDRDTHRIIEIAETQSMLIKD